MSDELVLFLLYTVHYDGINLENCLKQAYSVTQK